MRNKILGLACAVLILGPVWSTQSFGIPMVITGGTYTPESGDPGPVSGVVNFFGSNWVQLFSGGFGVVLLADGIEPPVETHEFTDFYSEPQGVTEDQVPFYAYSSGPDPFGRYMGGFELLTTYEGEYEAHCGGSDPWPCATVSAYEALHLPYLSVIGVGTIEQLVAQAIEYDAMVTTRSWLGDPCYVTDITLGRTLDFDYWWEMQDEPPPYQQGYMFDVLALQGGEGWQYIGQIDTYGSSMAWETRSLAVPENLWGTETEVRFVLNDYSPETRPSVYLRDVRTGPVPEPSALLMIGCGLIGFLALRGRFRKGDTSCNAFTDS